MRLFKQQVRAWLATAVLVFPCAVRGGFATNRLVLQQGAVPTLNGTAIPGAVSYTGTLDTYVFRDFPDTCFKDAPVLRFGLHDQFNPYGPASNHTTHAWILFRGFSDHLPTDAAVVNAGLYLTGAGPGAYGFVNAAQIDFMTVPWSTNMTWNTRTMGSVDYGSILRAYTWPSNEVRRIDLTAAVQTWSAGERPNVGLLLGSGQGNQQYQEHRCYSAECSVVTNRPRLEIDYVVGALVEDSGVAFVRSVVITNGAGVIEDTYIQSNGLNFVSGTYVPSFQTSNAGGMPERMLLRLKLSDAALANLARTGEADEAKPILVHAQLQLSVLRDDRHVYLDLWRPSQDWQVESVTGQTRDGVTPWAEPWGQMVSNVDGEHLARARLDEPFYAGTLSLDITAPLQQFIDGTNNWGFLIGNSGAWPYAIRVPLTEYGVSFQRPTLVMELKTPYLRGPTIRMK